MNFEEVKMELTVQHIEVHVSSIDKAREFYVHTLGLPVLDDITELNLLALRAGGVRISLFGGYTPRIAEDERKCGSHLIFRTNNLDETIKELTRRGVVFSSKITEAGEFIRDISTTDPDGNIIEFAEYLRDPLTPAGNSTSPVIS